jgi:hypothetical protein
MKRFAPLALLVLAFAITPVAFADDTTPAPAAPAATSAAGTTAAPAAPTADRAGHPLLRMRLEILRLRLQLVHVRYAIVCHDQQSDRCTQFTQKVVDRLTKIDDNVQSRIDALKQCTSDSTDAKCKNADKKIDLLTKIDERLQDVISKLGSPTPSSSSSDSAVDQAANALGQLAGTTQQP